MGKAVFPILTGSQQVERWDATTGGVVLSRLDPPTGFSFLTPAEQATAGALFDLLLAQRDEPKVPVLALADRRLAADETDGWHPRRHARGP